MYILLNRKLLNDNETLKFRWNLKAVTHDDMKSDYHGNLLRKNEDSHRNLLREFFSSPSAFIACPTCGENTLGSVIDIDIDSDISKTVGDHLSKCSNLIKEEIRKRGGTIENRPQTPPASTATPPTVSNGTPFDTPPSSTSMNSSVFSRETLPLPGTTNRCKHYNIHIWHKVYNVGTVVKQKYTVWFLRVRVYKGH